MLRTCVILCFFLFLNIQAKDLSLELEADFPDKSTVRIEYFDKVNYFSPGELCAGVEKPHICDVVFFSNTKQHIELRLLSKEGKGEEFVFWNSDKTHKITFHLFTTDDRKPIENRGILISETSTIAPISKVIPIGLRLPNASKNTLYAGMFSTKFIVTLNHTG